MTLDNDWSVILNHDHEVFIPGKMGGEILFSSGVELGIMGQIKFMVYCHNFACGWVIIIQISY